MKVLGVIPARYASTRFPGKPLVNILGKSMIQRVYEQVQKCSNITDIVVATDDQRIFDHVQSFGGEVMMTSENHQSGTDRCAEVAGHYEADFVINIQGDEPFIDPAELDKIVACLREFPKRIATLVCPFPESTSVENPNSVKVVLNHEKKAIYFSRSVIPFPRNNKEPIAYYQHVGVYGFPKSILLALSKLPQTKLESVEQLEQLRWLFWGHDIQTVAIPFAHKGIDTQEDLNSYLASIPKNL